MRIWPDDGRFEAAVRRGSYWHPRLTGVTFDREGPTGPERAGGDGSGPLLHALGASAVVFFGRRGPQGVALRCPTRDLGAGATRRYEKLAAQRAAHPPLAAALAEAEWIDQGLEIDGTWWPVIVMERVEGRSLAGQVEHVLGRRPAGLHRLAQDWAGFVAALGAADVAHGDLQQNNIFVTASGRLKAVDLDGVWLPAVAHLPPDETGHRHYQHPRRRRGDWGRTVDTFSALVIYLSLRALAVEPDLWGLYHNGENLVFTDDDLAHPDQTPLWDRLNSSPDQDVRRLVPLLRELCHGPADPGWDLAGLLEGYRRARSEGLLRSASLRRPAGHDDVSRWWDEPEEAAPPDPDTAWSWPDEAAVGAGLTGHDDVSRWWDEPEAATPDPNTAWPDEAAVGAGLTGYSDADEGAGAALSGPARVLAYVAVFLAVFGAVLVIVYRAGLLRALVS
ncbi:hypothetical protein [Frankia sp. AgB32]|uniref:hypothetical protein n=1 Tax=Frankia sp. AgB32 TaxID=631119 RepID=UPI00200C900A|nr:hypothetical protein [Frankia sp. AgB32]MCK9896444.1 hypothetical protein [Frankia sp. AgB32]